MLDLIEKQFGVTIDLSYEIRNNRVWVMSREVKNTTFEIPISSKGVYFGYIEHNGIRLSIEGSQIIGKLAKKNVLEFNEKEMHEWFNGMAIEKECDPGYLIIKYKEDFIGCGKSNGKTIWNSVPKERRIRHFKKA